ncbi:ArsR family transcriptional regulator [Deinococcus radiophilus]|uniref:ArsR family transcriptional regulator n=1 Tax=Deinococcus radiophilus TaxID=32062 RepID=A0A3S0KC99_9DEIO|nr:ArsR family transcriptional regulator [Deinococcus radiophilus]RTR27541.1 ArsR family transcriptional regulator [Deinococcus radiophilus]UFA50417.1 ArsR family transcriptional regulator [Deinococcus radiophilus]
MKPADENSVLHVQTPQVAAAVSQVEHLRRLRHFMTNPAGMTVRQFAQAVGWPDVRAYRLVQRYEQLGLLRLVREQPRSGKPLRYYHCPYRQFFIPLALMSVQDYLDLSFAPYERAMRDQLAAAVSDGPLAVGGFLASAEQEHAISLLPATREGQPWNPLQPDTSAVHFGLGPLYLSHTQAKALQLDLLELFERYGQLDGPARYMYQVMLTPAPDKN